MSLIDNWQKAEPTGLQKVFFSPNLPCLSIPKVKMKYIPEHFLPWNIFVPKSSIKIHLDWKLKCTFDYKSYLLHTQGKWVWISVVFLLMHKRNECKVNNLILCRLIWCYTKTTLCALESREFLWREWKPRGVGFGCRKRPSLLDLAAWKSHSVPTLSAPKVKVWRLGLLINKHKQSVIHISIE